MIDSKASRPNLNLNIKNYQKKVQANCENVKQSQTDETEE
jgi:hypothetical protein